MFETTNQSFISAMFFFGGGGGGTASKFMKIQTNRVSKNFMIHFKRLIVKGQGLSRSAHRTLT